MTDEELDAQLRALPEGPPPPTALEDRVVTELRRRGAFRRARPTLWLAVAAACLVVGFFAGRASPAPEFTYVLLLHEDASFDDAGGHVEEYRAWLESVRQRGVHIAGTKLGDPSRVEGGALPATSDRTTGYFTVEGSYEDALSIARSCPHLRHGGRIELRPIEKT